MQLCLASSREKNESLVGDELVKSPSFLSTHGVTIDKSPVAVWPWLVQMGQGRGGFYSYTAVENLFGCRMKNANQLYPHWQQISVGDTIQLHPRFAPLSVKCLQEGDNLVLYQMGKAVWSWVFVLRPSINRKTGGQSTRLLIRTRVRFSQKILARLIWPAMNFGHYVMERRMLLGIKQRAESIGCDKKTGE